MSTRPPRNGDKKIESINTLLLDSNSIFKSSFFGAKDSYNRQGEHVGGLYQFITMVRKLLNENIYHNVYAFWDGNFSGKLRWEFYKDYKSGRGKDYINGTEPKDESELLQRLKVQEYLEELYIRQLEDEVIESDDFIAYYSLIRKSNEKITICSGDSDLYQLINENVNLYSLKLKKYIDINNFKEEIGFPKENAKLIKIICGDSSDSIKGIKGVAQDGLLDLFPELKERICTLDEILLRAKELQEIRINNKLKPLKKLDNIINIVTDGIQGTELYEINNKLVDLSKPLITEQGIKQLENLIDSKLSDDRSIKSVYEKMKRDGIDELLGEYRIIDYLTPFKKLSEREKQII